MKIVKYGWTLLLLTAGLFTSCVDNEPEIEHFPGANVAFDYKVINPTYQLDFLVGDTIQFYNTSSASGACTWDFGDLYAAPEENRSVEPNPKHAFSVAGTYEVKLAIAGEGAVTQKIYISDILPTVTTKELPDGMCVVKQTPVELEVYLPNPTNATVEYHWTFPEGTMNAQGEEITEYVGENPGKVYFGNVGSQQVRLDVWLGGRQLEAGILNVQVAYTEPVKTLYYAVKKGNIMALKLVSNAPDNMKILPFDLGVKSGNHPLNILFNESSLYIIDPGKQFTYTNDADSILGDGRIQVISADGSTVETMLVNNKYAFDDPFYGYIDPTERALYFSDRNTGFRKISLDERNKTFSRSEFPYFVQNARLGYYGNGIVYGSMNANFMKVDNTWWWAKTFNGTGIFRFTDSDIQSKDVAAGTVAAPTAGSILTSGLFVKSFVVDKTRGFLYFTIYEGSSSGLYKAPLSEVDQLGTISKLAPYRLKAVEEPSGVLEPDNEGSSGEYITICQLALDEEDGSVYFGFRSSDPAKVKSGLKRYNPASDLIEPVVETNDVEIYGVTINNNKSQLF